MSYDYSNYTNFGINNEVERYAYAGWLIFVVFCSLLGDTIILVASIKYQAFNLHKIVVVFIQHLAVCDLFDSIGNILPAIFSLIANSGGSSKDFNFVRFFINYYVNCVISYLIGALTLGKLLLLKYPLRTVSWTTRQAHKSAAAIWMVLLSIPTLHLLIDKDDVTFDYRVYFCTYRYSSSVWQILSPITSLAMFAPNIIMVVSSILLLKEARKVVRGTRESLRWKGVMAVVLTATINILTYIPITAYFMAEPFVTKNPLAPGIFYVEFYRSTTSTLGINVLGNFFVYSLTVSSFRTFLRIKMRQTALFLTKKVPCYVNADTEDEAGSGVNNGISKLPGRQVTEVPVNFSTFV